MPRERPTTVVVPEPPGDPLIATQQAIEYLQVGERSLAAKPPSRPFGGATCTS
jgi:hypothetical protein